MEFPVTPSMSIVDGVSAERWTMSFASLTDRPVDANCKLRRETDYARRVENAKAQFAAAKAKRERKAPKRLEIQKREFIAKLRRLADYAYRNEPYIRSLCDAMDEVIAERAVFRAAMEPSLDAMCVGLVKEACKQGLIEHEGDILPPDKWEWREALPASCAGE